MCGNFVMIGYDSGYVDKYNIQSGIHRGSLSQDEQGGPAHLGTTIRGICSDGLNQVKKFYHFKALHFPGEMQVLIAELLFYTDA